MVRYRIATLALLLFVSASIAGQSLPPSEQVLVPFDTSTIKGANDALWSAELRVRNAADSEVNLFPELCTWLGQLSPCERKILVPAHTTQVLDVVKFVTPSIPGVLLYVPLDRVDDVQFSLRVRDARSSDAVGTMVPVVRVRDFRSRYTIIGVPIAAGQRRTLRIYEPHLPVQSVFRIRVFDEADNRTLSDREYTGWQPTDPPSPVLVPATFDFSDALAGPELSTAQHVSVSIERVFPEALTFWPMISTTGNSDHRIAIFTSNQPRPNGEKD
jgi:hypothetical protein